MSIEQQIAAALAGRAAQRDFMDGLVQSWEQLSGTWASLLLAAADLGGSAAVHGRRKGPRPACSPTSPVT